MSIKFNHIGVPIARVTPEMEHHADGKFWECGPDANPFHVEFMHFEDDAPYPVEHKTLPHVCFEVDDMEPYFKYAERIILGPCAVGNLWAVFFQMKDLPLNIELYCEKKPDIEPVGI